MAEEQQEKEKCGPVQGAIKRHWGKGTSGISVVAVIGWLVTGFGDLQKTVAENHKETLREFRKLDKTVSDTAGEYIRQLAEAGIQIEVNKNSIADLQSKFDAHISKAGHPVMEERVKKLERHH